MEELNNEDKTDDEDDTGKTMKSLNFQSLAKKVSARWRNIDKATKEKYEAKAEENRRLYHIAVAKFREETLGIKPSSDKEKNETSTPSSQEQDDTNKQDRFASKTGDDGAGEEDVQMQEGEGDDEMDESEEEGGSREEDIESQGAEKDMDESAKGNEMTNEDREAQAHGKRDSDQNGEESGNPEKEGAASDDDDDDDEEGAVVV